MTAQFENSFELDIQFVFEHYFNRRSISVVSYAFCYKEEREILRRFTLSLFSPYKKHRYMSRNLLEKVNFLFRILHFIHVTYLNTIKCTWNYTQIYLNLFLKLQWPPWIELSEDPQLIAKTYSHTGDQIMINNSIIYKIFKVFTNHRKNTHFPEYS